MYVLCYGAHQEGYTAILGADDQYWTNLTCKDWFEPGTLEQHFMKEVEGVRVYYIGEDVLYMFNKKLELLDVLQQLHKVVKKDLTEADAEHLCQKLLGCNTGTAVDITYVR